jgi:L,D-transpeptidase YcbB
MGGRPLVVGLRALAVAIVLTSPLAGAVLAEQIRAPIPGLDKPKVFKRAQRPFRPTMPQRNPERAPVIAGISADAGPAAGKARAGATSAAGISSATNAGVELAYAGPPPSAVADAPMQTASLPRDGESAAPDADSTASPSPVDGADAQETPAETAEMSPGEDAEDPAEPAANESSSEDTDAPEVKETAEASADTDADANKEPAADTETADDASNDEGANDAEPAEETASTDADANNEPAADTETANDSPGGDAKETTAPVETAEGAPSDEPADPAEEAVTADAAPAEDTKPAPTDAAEDAADPDTKTAEDTPSEDTDEPTPEIVDASPDEVPAEPAEVTQALASELPAKPEPVVEPEPVVMAKAPSHDATVVLEVLPPPEETEPASPQMAALTPPSVPEPIPTIKAGEEDTQSEDKEEPAAATTLEPAPNEAEATTEPTEPDASAAAEAPASDGDTPTDAAEDTAPAMPASVVEVEAPPANPVIVAIRAKLTEPDLRKRAADSDIEALEQFYAAHQGPPLLVSEDGLSPKAKAIADEIRKADEWGLQAASFDLPSTDSASMTPDDQAAAEVKLAVAALSYARDAQIGRLTPSRVSPLFDQAPELRDPNVVFTELTGTGDPSGYLQSLHPQHAQFKKLRAVLAKARAANNTRDVQRIVINMERWRWMPRQLGAYHVWNNVPEFNARVIKNGKTIYLEKTIVGQDKYATPFFSAPMRSIVFHPDWTVPPTILKEDLAPKLQSPRGFFGNANTAVLRQHGLTVKYKGEPVDPEEVDWQNVNIHTYTFVQAPGPTNVLGQFKFNFPNKHAIYMHDTPQRELFAETTRTLSHGCIRVREPDRLAALLLAEDKGWSYGQIQNLVTRNTNTVIALRRPMPVHLTYFTAMVDEGGRLQTFGDIYGLDNRMAPKLFARPVQFQVPAEPALVEVPSRGSGQRSVRRGGGGGLNDLISGLFGN